mgnify:FL=1
MIHKMNRVSVLIGTLFLFYSCSSQIPSSWVLRDIQSLDAKIMNTKDWLKAEMSNYKYLKKTMKKELAYYRKKDFRVYQEIDKEIDLIANYLDKVKLGVSKQVKLATRIKKRPSLGVFDKNSSQKKKKGLFSKKNDNSTQNKSEKAIKIIKSLEKNSIQILANQSNYITSIGRLISIFRKKKHRLVFIRDQVREWGQEVKGLAYERQKLVPTLANFNLILSEALFKSAESEYANNIVNLSRRLERFNNQMDKFEAYVNNLESIAGKQAKGLVYLIKEGEEKNYEKKYKKDLENYQSILKEIPKMIESV